MASLPTESLNLGNSHSVDAHLTQGIANVIESKWFDDCCNQLH
jgi:hypothetical protein